jgi:hypothetical protein
LREDRGRARSGCPGTRQKLQGDGDGYRDTAGGDGTATLNLAESPGSGGAKVKDRRIIGAGWFALCLAVLAGCGGTSGSPDQTPGGSGGTVPTFLSIVITPNNPSIAAGSSVQFTATGTYSDGSTTDLTASVTWSSSDTAVATASSTGLATAKTAGTATIAASSGSISGMVALTVSPLSLSMVKKVTLTGSGDGGSARPEMVVTANRAYVVYLGNIASGINRTFNVKIYDANLASVITSSTIVSPSAEYGGPTDIRIASDGQSVYAFYETYLDSTGSTYLWGAKYALNDNFERAAFTPAPIASSRQMVNPPDGRELLNDPAPLIGPNSVFVVTRYDNSLSLAGNTMYHVREFNKDTLAQISSFDLDLSAAADGRGRVASLLYWNNNIYMALSSTVSDLGLMEGNDDGAQCDIVLVKMKPDWTFDPLTDVRTISAESNDRENYITGLRADGTYFYLTYKQAVGSPPTGEQRAVIKVFDKGFNLLLKQIVKSVPWGEGGGDIRPSLEVYGNRIYSGQDDSNGIGTGNAEVYVYQKN